jgi:ACS family hexuronate transporter-like MFS transporter
MPTRFVAWLPTVSMLLVSLISYVDRTTLALLAPTILKETDLSARQYGFIIAAFSVAYMIGNPFWGIVLDRYGLRRGMFTAVSLWTLASATHAFASGFWTFASARALLGFGEGATFPGGLRTAVQTLPPHQRSRGTAVAYSGGSLGAIATPIIITPIAVAFGWRGAFLFTGIIGLVWLVLWHFISRKLVSDMTPSPAVESGARVNGRPSWKNRRLWAFMASYALGGLPLAFVIYGAAIYLSQARSLNQSQIGALLWIPPLGWEVGYFFWGWMTDRFRHRLGFDGLLGTTAVLSLPLAATAYTQSLSMLMTGLFFAMFVAAGFVIISIAYATEVFSSDNAGLIAGLGAGSWSAIVALTMPVFGDMFDARQYNAAFLAAALIPPIGYSLWRILDQKPSALG